MTEDDATRPLDGMPSLIDRASAKAKGLRFYFTGKPCARGHVAQRFVSASACIECRRAKDTERYRINPEAGRERARRSNKTRVKPPSTPESRAKEAAYRRSYIAANSEQRERHRERGRRYRRIKADGSDTASVEKNRKWQREYAAKNRDKLRALQKRWRAANPEKVKAKESNRTARVRGAPGRHTAADIKRIYQMQKGKCAYCRCCIKARAERDHIIPIARGGSNWPSNIQLTCRSCNAAKKAKDPLVWARELGKLL